MLERGKLKRKLIIRGSVFIGLMLTVALIFSPINWAVVLGFAAVVIWFAITMVRQWERREASRPQVARVRLRVLQNPDPNYIQQQPVILHAD